MTRSTLFGTLAVLLTVAATIAIAQDVSTIAQTPSWGPGWRHQQMMQARQASTPPTAWMAQRGPGMGMGLGTGLGQGRGFAGLPRNADGTIDTSQLPAWCPLKNAPQSQ